jgi:hypothetical protein
MILIPSAEEHQKHLDDADTQSLFNSVRQGMGAKKKKKEVVELWQIAPKYDQQNLRENYLTGKIFRIGDIVENLNTGLVGEVMRRGTNHLIYVTEQGYMFKSWIKDLMEYTERVMNPQIGYSNIKDFINKYKVKSK